MRIYSFKNLFIHFFFFFEDDLLKLIIFKVNGLYSLKKNNKSFKLFFTLVGRRPEDTMLSS